MIDGAKRLKPPSCYDSSAFLSRLSCHGDLKQSVIFELEPVTSCMVTAKQSLAWSWRLDEIDQHHVTLLVLPVFWIFKRNSDEFTQKTHLGSFAPKQTRPEMPVVAQLHCPNYSFGICGRPVSHCHAPAICAWGWCCPHSMAGWRNGRSVEPGNDRGKKAEGLNAFTSSRYWKSFVIP